MDLRYHNSLTKLPASNGAGPASVASAKAVKERCTDKGGVGWHQEQRVRQSAR